MGGGGRKRWREGGRRGRLDKDPIMGRTLSKSASQKPKREERVTGPVMTFSFLFLPAPPPSPGLFATCEISG